MSLEKRADGKCGLSTVENKIIDVINGMGRHDFVRSGLGESFAFETWIMIPTGAISGSGGYYTGKFLAGDAAPQAGDIDVSDFGTPDTGESCIIANLAELAGGGSLTTDGTVVVFGRMVGFNSIANGGVGTINEDKLPIFVTGGAGGGSIGTGQYQGMAYLMISQNQAGFSDIVATAME